MRQSITAKYDSLLFLRDFKNYSLEYVEEDKPLGTAGSLQLIKEEFSRPFIVTNCDILIHADYEDIYRYHKEAGNELTIVTALKNIEVPYGVIHSSENGAVQSMEEKPKLSYFVNTGMYILNPALKKRSRRILFSYDGSGRQAFGRKPPGGNVSDQRGFLPGYG